MSKKWGETALAAAMKNPDIRVPGAVTDVTPAAAELAKARRAAGNRTLADRFERLWAAANGPTLTPEYRFHAERNWRADYCHEPSRTLIELEGGTWAGGRHTRGAGYAEDCRKYLAAVVMGYAVVRLTGEMITADNVRVLLDFVTEVTR